jgi:hypothetical protein
MGLSRTYANLAVDVSRATTHMATTADSSASAGLNRRWFFQDTQAITLSSYKHGGTKYLSDLSRTGRTMPWIIRASLLPADR